MRYPISTLCLREIITYVFIYHNFVVILRFKIHSKYSSSYNHLENLAVVVAVAPLLQELDHQVEAVHGGFSRKILQDLKCKSDVTSIDIICVIYA